MNLNMDYAKDWLNKLKLYWFNKDVEKASSLFTKTTLYQETPFMNSFNTFEEVSNEWKRIKEQDIKEITFKILAIDNNTLIVNWIFKRDITEFDGIYEIKFDNNLDCMYFKCWEMKK